MERDKLKQLALHSGFDVVGVQGFIVATGLEGTQDHKLRSLIALVEKETLERAAKVCDDASEFAITSAQESSFIYCATKIRNLKISDQ